MATTAAATMNKRSTPKRRKKERLGKDAKIAVIGGGLGGLGAAICLHQAGFHNVSIFERDPRDTPRKGYGMTLAYNPKGPLAHMGILEQVAACDCPSRSHYVFDTDGRVMGYYGNAFVPHRGKGQRGNLRVPRSVLLGILQDRLESSETRIQYDKRLVTFSRDEDEEQPKITLHFDDGSTLRHVDLLVAADGIRSSVVKTLISKSDNDADDTAELQYMNVFLILGIADFLHPLTDERGFYTLDGTHRLFTMPYQGSRLDGTKQQRRVMWQLSYRFDDLEEAKLLAAAGGECLREEVLRRCHSWHAPVMDMIRATPEETIWGTPLMDRDPKHLLQHQNPTLSRCVVVLGDAAHPMSCFKGQGANQAFMDGPLLASWLERANADAAVRGFMREMTQRTSPKVLASREAARTLHSSTGVANSYDFAGVRPDSVPDLLMALRERQIGANIDNDMDSSVLQVICQLGIGVEETSADGSKPKQNEAIHRRAIEYAASGNTQGLRDLSLSQSASVSLARDSSGRSCLHVAVAAGHHETCRWLLSEVFPSANLVDKDNQTPHDIAQRSGNEKIAALLSA